HDVLRIYRDDRQGNGLQPPGGIERARRCNRNRGDDRADVRLENVGAHARDVADIVAHVVRDRCGVARVVLGNARLDLADEVRTNVGCLRVDAATDAGEERDRAGTHAEAADDAGKPDEITVGNGA